jgi:hypothetical protein
VWIFEADVRWTGAWADLLLSPYASLATATVDLFAFRTAHPWRRAYQGWETSNCWVPLGRFAPPPPFLHHHSCIVVQRQLFFP